MTDDLIVKGKGKNKARVRQAQARLDELERTQAILDSLVSLFDEQPNPEIWNSTGVLEKANKLLAELLPADTTKPIKF